VTEPVWLDRLIVEAVHFDQIRLHGGLPGIRDENALESALARPRNRSVYQAETDLIDLAAAYGYALTTSHPFNDGNKRIGFLAMYVFLGLNGREIVAEETEVVELMITLAGGERLETDVSAWLRDHVE
jgi:death-on-curing protein